MNHEWERSNPDIQVFIPGKDEYEGDNEHFLVFEMPDKKLAALWTQSSTEGFGDNHLVLARSEDGITWTQPKYIIGSTEGERGNQASWGFPILADTGRLYIFYTKDVGVHDLDTQTTGTIGLVYSDDCGESFTVADDLDIQKNEFDHPDSKIPPNWIVWQKPIQDSQGRWMAGYTRWSSPQVKEKFYQGWYSKDSRVHFMRFDNIHLGPEPSEIKITWLPNENVGLTVPYPEDDTISVAQEPSLVLLPDHRIFCTMRTFTGYIWYAVSDDDGESWTAPEVLRYCDNGEKIKQPIASCPIYPMSDGKYVLIFHNNDGHLENFLPKDALYNRRPAFIAVGNYMPNAHQPLWFSKPSQILDTDGVVIGPKGTTEIATYPSYIEYEGKRILWYPDRKYFLLGKYLTDEILFGEI